MRDIFRTKSIDMLKLGAEKSSLKKSLGMADLIFLGIGCVIGTGIFVLTGVAAAKYAGPGIMFSFVLAGIACLFTALAYAELASMVPISGTVYAYSYVSLGEIFAWLTGWCLFLEYSVGASVVAAGWSGYMTNMLEHCGIVLPASLTTIPSGGGLVNLPAMIIVLILTLLLVRGTKESIKLNKILVFIKLFVIAIFILLALPHVETSNWTPLLPYGFAGIAQGAAFIFLAYCGFDAVATAAEECRNPNRDLPIGIIVSLLICTALYIIVAAILTGIVPYGDLDTAAPVSFALHAIGQHLGAALIGAGAIAGITTVLLVLMYGQSRVIFSMSRDGLLPQSICSVHARFGTPYKVTIIVGILVALMAGFMPINQLVEFSNIGALAVFIAAAVGALLLRYTAPDAIRPFRCPALPIVALLAIFSCSYLIFSLSLNTWYLFIAWIMVGLVVYFAYSYRNSTMNGDVALKN